MKALKLLILGGSGEAAALARALDGDARYQAVLSLAGRTEQPLQLPVTVRRGGFGGVQGLAATLRHEGFEAMLDATHPFARQVKQHAVEAAREAGVAMLAIRRPAWTRQTGDRWIEVNDLEAAALALGQAPRNVFLTTGRNELGPFRAAGQHLYLLRSVEAPAPEQLPPRVALITARGPFALEDELALMRTHTIEFVVTKNSGGDATRAKLDAARALDMPVIMVQRPKLPEAPSVESVAEALAWLARRHAVTSSA